MNQSAQLALDLFLLSPESLSAYDPYLGASDSRQHALLTHRNFSSTLHSLYLTEISSSSPHNSRPNLIHLLPIDIIATILGYAAASRHYYVQDVLHLAHVCKRWSDIVTGNAGFWPVIDSRYPFPVDIIVKRNKGSGVKVICNGDVWRAEAFLGVAARYSATWTSIDFSAVISRAVKRSLEQPTPRLKRLSIHANGLEGSVGTKIAVSEGAPFESVDLEGISIPWHSKRLSSLLHLRLHYLSSNQPNISQLFTILSASPNLISLELTDWSLDMDVGPTQNLPENIDLPCLKSMELTSLPPTYAAHVFFRIKAHACTSVRVQKLPPFVRGALGPIASFDALNHALDTARGAIFTFNSTNKTLRLESGSGRTLAESRGVRKIGATPSEAGFEVDYDVSAVNEAWWNDLCSWMAPRVAGKQVELALKADYPGALDATGLVTPATELSLSIISRSLPFITDLSFWGYYNATTLLTCLSRPLSTDLRNPEWPCPNLVSCDLRWIAHSQGLHSVTLAAQALVRLLRRRVEAAPASAVKKVQTVWVPPQVVELFATPELFDKVSVRTPYVRPSQPVQHMLLPPVPLTTPNDAFTSVATAHSNQLRGGRSISNSRDFPR